MSSMVIACHVIMFFCLSNISCWNTHPCAQSTRLIVSYTTILQYLTRRFYGIILFGGTMIVHSSSLGHCLTYCFGSMVSPHLSMLEPFWYMLSFSEICLVNVLRQHSAYTRWSWASICCIHFLRYCDMLHYIVPIHLHRNFQSLSPLCCFINGSVHSCTCFFASRLRGQSFAVYNMIIVVSCYLFTPALPCIPSIVFLPRLLRSSRRGDSICDLSILLL